MSSAVYIIRPSDFPADLRSFASEIHQELQKPAGIHPFPGRVDFTDRLARLSISSAGTRERPVFDEKTRQKHTRIRCIIGCGAPADVEDVIESAVVEAGADGTCIEPGQAVSSTCAQARQLSLRDMVNCGCSIPALKGRATVKCRSAANRRFGSELRMGTNGYRHVSTTRTECRSPRGARFDGSRGFQPPENSWQKS